MQTTATSTDQDNSSSPQQRDGQKYKQDQSESKNTSSLKGISDDKPNPDAQRTTRRIMSLLVVDEEEQESMENENSLVLDGCHHYTTILKQKRNGNESETVMSCLTMKGDNSNVNGLGRRRDKIGSRASSRVPARHLVPALDPLVVVLFHHSS
jgi:hypothetical protein